MAKRIAFYCRVSSSRQEKEQTIQTQLVKLREAYQGENVVKEYCDDGYSGTNLSRPALTELREDAKKGLFDVLAIYHIDRLSRSPGYYYAIRDQFEELKIKIEVMGRTVAGNPELNLEGGVQVLFAEYHRARLIMGMKDGKDRKLNNKILIGCYPPYGWNLIPVNREKGREARFEINPQEMKIIQLIFKFYEEEQSFRKVEKRLIKMGIKSRGRWRNGSAFFHHNTISKMLRNEVYVGRWHYGKTTACKPQYHIKKVRKTKSGLTGRKIMPREDWKLVEIPPIIDKVTFERVQGIIEERKKRYLRPTKYHYLCQGLIRCIYCGRTYFGKKHSKSNVLARPTGSHYNYVCPQKYKSSRNPNEKKCPSRRMSTRKLDNAVWSYVSALIQNPQKVKNAVKSLKEKRDSERGFNQIICDSLANQIGKLKQKKSKFLDLYADGTYNKEDLDAKILECNVVQAELEKQIKDAEKELEGIEEVNAMEDEIEQLCMAYQGKIKGANFNFRKRAIKRWVREISITDEGNIIVKVRIPPLEKPPKNLLFKSQYLSSNNGVTENTQSLLNVSNYPIIELNEILRV